MLEMNLLLYNKIACFLHLINSILFLVFGASYSIPLCIQYAKWVNKNNQYNCFDKMQNGEVNKCIINYEMNEIGVFLNLKYLIFSFSFISSIFHFLPITIIPNSYLKNISIGRNPIRWIEYMITAPIMILCITLLNGITNVQTLILSYVLMSTIMMLGWLQEDSKNRGFVYLNTPTVFGWFPYLTVWAVIYLTFCYSVIETDVKTPVFVYIVVYTMFILFSSFGFVQLLYESNNSLVRSYQTSEKLYICLSLTSKILLSWIIFFGMNSR